MIYCRVLKCILVSFKVHRLEVFEKLSAYCTEHYKKLRKELKCSAGKVSQILQNKYVSIVLRKIKNLLLKFDIAIICIREKSAFAERLLLFISFASL